MGAVPGHGFFSPGGEAVPAGWDCNYAIVGYILAWYPEFLLGRLCGRPFLSERGGSGSGFVAGDACFQRTQRLSNEARRGEAGLRL
jgi:hypothetical protein